MREIKFRAWDEQSKVMHQDFQFIKSGNEGNDWIVFISDKQKLIDTLHPFDNPYLSQQFKVMLFTGLHDTNGREIYEGDVVVIKMGDGERYSAVNYKNSSFMVDAEGFFGTEEFDLCTLSYAVNEMDEVIVIGNIYENPELL